MFNVGVVGAQRQAVPPGEAILVESEGSWVAPAGVTSVCVVLIGRGGGGVQYPSSSRSAGGGGALVYKNSVPVVPGQAYAYTAGESPSTRMFGLTAGGGTHGANDSSYKPGGVASTAGAPTAAFDGGAGTVSGSLADVFKGGGAASYTANGSYGGGTGTGLFGTESTGDYGRGGNSVYSSGSTASGLGAIRIIWGGSGRSFPSNAI